VAASERALEYPSDERVRALAQGIVERYGAAGDDLAKAAPEAGAEMPDDLGVQGEQMLKRLPEERSDAFDLLYATQRKLQHARLVGLFENAARTSTVPALQSFAQDLLPALEANERQASVLQSELEEERRNIVKER
jgi:predicted outer membrane protein